jgi:HAE1 family hydrophobic/amphiphilic exporter-1/multidrug efflux pump
VGQFFVHRRVVAVVVSLLIVIIGAGALRSLPIAMFPDVAPPTVAISAMYPGANALTVEQSVAANIERALTGVDGLLYTSSQSANDGSYGLTATFASGTNVDQAATNVQNKVNAVVSSLPAEVARAGVTVSKSATDTLLALAIYSPDASYDELFISNYVTINVLDRIARLDGVGGTQIAGQRDYSMRIWLRPDRLAQFKLQPSDVIAAITDQNAPAPAGQIGQPPQKAGSDFQYSVNVRGQLASTEAFENIVLRTLPDGSVLRLRAVARVELAAKSYASFGRFNGLPAAIITVRQKPGANALVTAQRVKDAMTEAAKDFPHGLTWTTAIDSTDFVKESIHDVEKTLFEALALVVIVVFLFLGTFRAMIIPIIAVPVSLIGTFAVFVPLGFGINTLTLFGIVLAIGIVVDDAIVVVEAVEGGIERGLTPLAATETAMREVSGPVVAIALVLCAVFVPVAFLGGLTGTLYKQFALTLSISVLISALVALTTTPALCVMILRPRKPGRGPLAKLIGGFNRGFDFVLDKYTRAVGVTMHRLPLMLVALALFMAAAVFLLRSVPGSLVPIEDQGYFLAALNLPDGASLGRTNEVALRLEKYMHALPGVQSVASFGGYDLLSGTAASNAAFFFVKLHDWGERAKHPGESIDRIIGAINAEAAKYPEAVAFALNPPPIPGLGVTAGFQMQVEDRGGHSLPDLAAAADKLADAAAKRPDLSGVSNSFSVTVPQVNLDIDRDKAKALGIPLTDVYSSLQAYLGGLTVNDFVLFGRLWQVSVQAEPEFRVAPVDIGRVLVRSTTTGDMVPIGTFSAIAPAVGAAVIGHYNGLRTAAINGAPASGTSSGQALTAMDALAAQELPAGFTYEWTGSALQEKESGGKQAAVFGFSLLLVFLFLASLYESWAIPFSIILGIPLGVFGAFFGIFVRHIPNDVYVQIGLVMLIGLAAKNAILIVEFAKLKHEEGSTYAQAALAAAQLRLRPILMTSFAFIFGVVPLVLASGAGAASRQSLGTAVFSGMIAATLLGVFFIPALYVIVSTGAERLFGKRVRVNSLPAPEPAMSVAEPT